MKTLLLHYSQKLGALVHLAYQLVCSVSQMTQINFLGRSKFNDKTPLQIKYI